MPHRLREGQDNTLARNVYDVVLDTDDEDEHYKDEDQSSADTDDSHMDVELEQSDGYE